MATGWPRWMAWLSVKRRAEASTTVTAPEPSTVSTPPASIIAAVSSSTPTPSGSGL